MNDFGEHNAHEGFSFRDLPMLVLFGAIVLFIVVIVAEPSPGEEISREGRYETGSDVADGTWFFRIPRDGVSDVVLVSVSSGESQRLNDGDVGYVLATLSEGDIVQVSGEAVGRQVDD